MVKNNFIWDINSMSLLSFWGNVNQMKNMKYLSTKSIPFCFLLIVFVVPKINSSINVSIIQICFINFFMYFLLISTLTYWKNKRCKDDVYCIDIHKLLLYDSKNKIEICMESYWWTSCWYKAFLTSMISTYFNTFNFYFVLKSMFFKIYIIQFLQ